MSRTKDERYILAVYDVAKSKGDLYIPLNRYEVGDTIGYSPKLVKTLTINLMQANFLKKVDDDIIALTDNGIRLADKVRHETK